jgi:hypothetical protein
MARFQIRCPGCRKPFPWDPAIDLPERCPLKGCGYVAKKRDPEVDENGEIVIAAPFLRSHVMKANDGVYRELERSSEIRAQLAAEMAGVPVSEMSHLKVTNLRDNTRSGEVAAMPVVNDVTRQMDYIKSRGGSVGFGADASQFGPNIMTGAIELNGRPLVNGLEPSAGARMRKVLHQHHEQLSHGSATSDMPALETQQPGYRSRA